MEFPNPTRQKTGSKMSQTQLTTSNLFDLGHNCPQMSGFPKPASWVLFEQKHCLEWKQQASKVRRISVIKPSWSGFASITQHWLHRLSSCKVIIFVANFDCVHIGYFVVAGPGAHEAWRKRDPALWVPSTSFCQIATSRTIYRSMKNTKQKLCDQVGTLLSFLHSWAELESFQICQGFLAQISHPSDWLMSVPNNLPVSRGHTRKKFPLFTFLCVHRQVDFVLCISLERVHNKYSCLQMCE